MSSIEDRRRFLRAALGCAGASALGGMLQLPGLAFAQPRQGPITDVTLRDNVFQFSGAGGNVLLLRDSEGGVLVDSGSPETAAALLDAVTAKLDGGAVKLLFNTHWHPDNTGGNDTFSKAGAKIIAHANTRLWMSTEYYVDWEDRTYAPRDAAALPTQTFYSHEPQPIEIEFGSEHIGYGDLRAAHTDGDIYVRFREHNVIAAGGVVCVGQYPILDYATGGWIGGLMEATEKLLKMSDAETIIVPAIGPSRSRAYLATQFEMVSTVRGRVEDLMREGKSVPEMLAAGVTKDFDASFGNNSAEFLTNVYGGLWWQGRLNGAL